MSISIYTPVSPKTQLVHLKPNQNPLLLGDFVHPKRISFARRKCTSKALLSYSKEAIIAGLQNLDKENVASVVTAADKVCVYSVDPAAFPAAVEAGALMVEIGNYDSFYEKGLVFSPEQILNLTKETKRILPSVPVPHTLSLPDQVKLAEQLELEGVDIIQTEGGKCSTPSKAGVLGLIEKATPTLAAAYSISKAVNIPVMCSSGLSAVTAPMAIIAGAAGVGVGSAINKLNDQVAMIAEVKSIAYSLGFSTKKQNLFEGSNLRM
ncbi:unnamed protein product [Withania somnifera]